MLKDDLDYFPITSVSRSEIRKGLPVGRKDLADDDDFCSEVAYAIGEAYTDSGSYWADLDAIVAQNSKRRVG